MNSGQASAPPWCAGLPQSDGELTVGDGDDETGGNLMPNFSQLIDKVKQLAGKHPDQVNKGVDKVEDIADKKTGGKYESQIQEGGDRAEGFLGTQGQGNQGQGMPGQGTPGQGTGNQ